MKTKATMASNPAGRKLNASQTAAVERHYDGLDAARAEFRRLRIERDRHNADGGKILAEGGKVIWLADSGKFQLTHAAALVGWEFYSVFD